MKNNTLLIAKNDLTSIFGFISENTTQKYLIRLALALITLFILFIISKIFKKTKNKKENVK